MSNPFFEYAQEYKCSIAQAICDRDWPMTLDRCKKEFFDAAGREPTPEDIKEMRPDSDESTQSYEEWYYHD